MGYYSRFEIIVDDDSFVDAMLLALKEVTGYGNSFYDQGDYITLDDAKWYDYDKDLTEVSKLLPNLGFSLERTGEESPDGERWHMQKGVKTQEQHLGWVDGPGGRR